MEGVAGDVILSVGRFEPASPILDSRDSMVAPVLKVLVKAGNSKKSKKLVNAAFSISAGVSVIAVRLAKRLGLKFNENDKIDIVSPREWSREAYVPVDCLLVECIEDIVTSRTRGRADEYLERPMLQIAPVVCSSMTIDLLIGRDWLQHFGERTNIIYGPADKSSKIRCASGLHISLPWGRLDCNPNYNRNTSYTDHIMLLNDDAHSRIDTIRGYTNIEADIGCNKSDYTYNGSILDPVVSHHDIPLKASLGKSCEYNDHDGKNFSEKNDDDSRSFISGLSQHSDKLHDQCTPLEDPDQPDFYPWIPYVSPEGDIFYYNSETGESSWDMSPSAI